MNSYFIFIFVISFSTSAFCNGVASTNSNIEDNWITLDKLKHFSTAMYLTTTSYYIQNEIFDLENAKVNTVTFTIGCSIGKEVWDSRKKKGSFSIRDLIADFAGMAVAIVFINNMRNYSGR